MATTGVEVRPGDKIMCVWGRRGPIEVTVAKITLEGTVYAKRWRRGTRSFTLPRRIQQVNGVYTVMGAADSKEQRSEYPPQE